MFIWLGSGRARRRAVGPPARQLDQAANAGLPVPPGAVLLDEFYHFSLSAGLARANGRGVVIPDPELWHNTLFHSVRLPRFRRPVVVRAVCPAGETTTAGQTPIVGRDINFNNPLAAARALAAVWSAAPPGDPSRRDTLIIETIPAELTGTATTTTGAPADRVTIAGPGAAAFALPQLHGRRGPDAGQPPYARRLQQLLRGVRRTLGAGVWRVEWADDGRVCWLTQVDIAAPVEPYAIGAPGRAA